MLKASRILLYAWLGIFAAYFLAPLVIMLMTSFKSGEELLRGTFLSFPQRWTVAPWKEAWSTACIGASCAGLKPYYWNSARIVVPSVIVSTSLGAFNGYALSLWRFRGANTIFGLMVFGCFVPFQLTVLPMVRLFGWMGIGGSLGSIILIHCAHSVAYMTLFFRNYYVTIPRDLIHAASIDGAGFWTLFRRVILPLSPPIFIVATIWQFTGVWNDFLIGSIFSTGATQPVAVALNNLINSPYGELSYNVDMAATMMAALPTLLVYAMAGNYFARGLTAGAVKG